MQVHTRSDQTNPEQKILFWTDILAKAEANLLHRPSRVAWMDEEGREI
jgi:hypothetical protein